MHCWDECLALGGTGFNERASCVVLCDKRGVQQAWETREMIIKILVGKPEGEKINLAARSNFIF
jgi:hypothetical protein